MSVAAVREYLKAYGLENRVYEFDESSATVEEAAHAVGCEPQRIAKTMSFLVEGRAVLVVIAGDGKVDNAKFKAAFHTKAMMIPAESVQDLTGYPIGGVCPFAAREGVKVYLDVSLKRFDTVYPACGSRNSAVKLTPGELEQAAHIAGWVDIAKGWE